MFIHLSIYPFIHSNIGSSKMIKNCDNNNNMKSKCASKSMEEHACSQTKNVTFISIEGNIGAGKSTLFKNMQKYMDENDLNENNHVVFLREPVDIWENTKDENGKNMLELFYENPAKYAFEFQTLAFITQCRLIDETLRDNPMCKIIISERSFGAGDNVFTKMLHDDGCISHIQYKIYKQMLDNRVLCQNEMKHTGKPDKIIYLDVNPLVCEKRIQKRSRDGEESISLNYLEKCKKYHDEWLNNEKDADVFAIDDDCDLDEIISFVL